MQFFFSNPNLLQWAKSYVIRQGGNEADAKDVFTESFIIFERQVRLGKFRGESSLETYFHAITKWQWLALKRKDKHTLGVEHLEKQGSEANPENIYISDERKVILHQMISLIGEKCQTLIGLFQLSYSMKEIMERVGYASEHVAANQVRDCREKLKKVMNEHPEKLDVLKYRAR